MSTKNVLWVDDDVNRFALLPDRDELESRGCRIIEAPRPEDFLKVLNDQLFQIDCIIIDIAMPTGTLDMTESEYGMRTGFVLINKIRKSNSKYKNAKIIVYTVMEDSEVRQSCQNHNILYLSKSIKAEEFADRVMEYIEYNN